MKPPKSKIPTREQLDRASKALAERARVLAEARERVFARFVTRCHLHKLSLMDQMDVDVRAYVFAETDADLKAMHAAGLDRELMDAVYEELERVGRGSREQLKVAFEFDSHEQVEAKFNGNYLHRLH
jgi:hypothetical protein